MKLLGLVLILGLAAASSVLGKTGGPTGKQHRGAWDVDSKSSKQEIDWIKKVGRKLGITEKDLEVDFGPTDPTIEQNDAFQAAWKDFQASAQPSMSLFSKMNDKINKELEQATRKKSSKVARHLVENDKKPEKAADKSLTESVEAPAEKEEEEKKDEEKNEEKEEQENTENEEEEEDKPHKIDLITRLKNRVEKIDQKVNHLLFHNHHDLAGLTAHYTPLGIQMLPSYQGKDSIDQHLKAIDYMNRLGQGQGQNPMLQTILPYYMNKEHEATQGGNTGMGGRKLKRAW